MRNRWSAVFALMLVAPLIVYAGGKGGPPPAPTTNVSGTLSSATCASGAGKGWAYDSDTPSSPVTVYFWVDSSPSGYADTSGNVGTAVANEYQEGVCQGSNCSISYTFPIPSQYLDGTQHTLRAYGQDTSTGNGTAIGNQTFQCQHPPTCTITFDDNPIDYGESTTIHWDSTWAVSAYINGIGYVTANQQGSAVVSVGGDYTCTVTGEDTTRTDEAYLTVIPPANPSVSITPSSATIPQGATTTITATFTSNPLDEIVSNNIDYPAGTHLASSSDPDASKSVIFSTSGLSTGTYSVLARAITGYFSDWTTFATSTITVTDGAACTITFDDDPIAQGDSTTIRWTSSGADAFSINTIGSVDPNTSGSTVVSPSQTTDYTGTVTSFGYPFYCPATLNLSCTPAYSCSDTQTILYTASDCSTTSTTCEAPTFCSAGSSSCLYPSPQFNQGSGGLTGHLQVSPQVVHTGLTTTVSWNVSYVSSCTVTGDNGDSWSGASGSKISKAIIQQTVYTLSCQGLDGSQVSEKATVNVLPSFQET